MLRAIVARVSAWFAQPPAGTGPDRLDAYDVHQDPHRQSRRNRLPRRPHRAPDGHSHRGRVFGRRRRCAACRKAATRRTGWARRAARKLSERRRDPRDCREVRRAGDPSRIRLPLRERSVRGGLRARRGIVFIGPPPRAIAAMGSKSAAKTIMADARVPLVPGYHGDGQDPKHACARGGEDRLPGADQGDGGRRRQGHEDRHARRRIRGGAGVRAARGARRRSATIACCSSATSRRRATSRSRCSPTRMATPSTCSSATARCSAGTRRCWRRRRRRAWTPRRRRAMGDAAVAAAKAIGYVGAGTVEFIAEQDGTFYFMEMNTRLQVEHPVTEMITGLDLVEWQLRVAVRRAACRCARTNSRSTATRSRRASTPRTRIAASCRRSACSSHWRMPVESPRVRVDTGVRAGDEVSPFYDPMLAKLIVWGEDRAAACAEMIAALRQCEVVGVATNIAFLERVVAHEAFAGARRHRADREAIATRCFRRRAPLLKARCVAAAIAEYTRVAARRRGAPRASGDAHSPWHATDAWWLNVASTGVCRSRSPTATTRHEVARRAARRTRRARRVAVAARSTCISTRRDGRLTLDIDGARVRRDRRRRRRRPPRIRARRAPQAHVRRPAGACRRGRGARRTPDGADVRRDRRRDGQGRRQGRARRAADRARGDEDGAHDRRAGRRRRRCRQFRRRRPRGGRRGSGRHRGRDDRADAAPMRMLLLQPARAATPTRWPRLFARGVARRGRSRAAAGGSGRAAGGLRGRLRPLRRRCSTSRTGQGDVHAERGRRATCWRCPTCRATCR